MMTSARPSGAAEKALKERERLWRHYRSQRQKRRQELYQGHPRLEEFGRQIRRFGPDDAAGFFGAAGRERVEREFSETAMTPRVLEVYDAVA